jgi:hypothetical protein
MQSKYALHLQQLTAKPSRRLINQALKDENALNSTFIGQDRARAALSFGLGIEARGYNLYVMGEQATGRFTLVHEFIDKYVQKTVTPDDWCYINNFEDEREPFSLRLVAGEGKKLIKDMENLRLHLIIPAISEKKWRLLESLIKDMIKPLMLLKN